MNKEREAFENHLKKMGKTDNETFSKNEDDSYQMDIIHFGWKIWQAAKAQAVPENKQFNLDEFLKMEEKLKSKGSVIVADLDRFIAYAEMVLEKAKALKEPK